MSRATELLRRTESYAASKWETAALGEEQDSIEGEEHGASREFQANRPNITYKDVIATENWPLDERTEDAGQFQSLQIAPTPQSRLVCLPDSDSPAMEAFHLLGVRLRHLRTERPLKKVLVTSTIPQEGKSLVAANLACTLALRTQQKIVLLEGDLRRPTQSKVFGIGNHPGICEWLKGEQSLRESIYRLDGAGVWMLPAGSASSNSLELLQSGKLTAMMNQLGAWFDWIIIDSPPVLPLADTSVWTNLADGILLVTRQGTTEKRQLKRGLEALDPQKLIGALMNCSESVARSDYYYRPATTTQQSEVGVP
jgi:capsular exopolysaccharide synthesis family protein